MRIEEERSRRQSPFSILHSQFSIPSVVGNNDTLADALRNDRVTGGQILAYALEESNDTRPVVVLGTD